MDKRQIVASLNKIANELDTNSLFNEANEVTEIMVKLSQSLFTNNSFGNVPLGIDPNNIPNIPKPYQALGPHQNTGKQNMEYTGYKKNFQGKNPMQYSGYKDPKVTQQSLESAQDWININSNLVGGDIMSLAQKAIEGYNTARDKNVKKKFNDIIYILKNHPRYKKESYEKHSDPLAPYGK